MSADAETVLDQAIAWHLRLPMAGVDDWCAFTAWLEASPDHAAAYDALANEDADLSDALLPGDWLPQPSIDDDGAFGGWRRWQRFGLAGAGTAVAAGLGVFLLPLEFGTSGDPLVFQTDAGVRRIVRLDDGTTVALNGDTRLLVERDDPRMATLERGEALFTVRHDAAHPFEVRSGDVRLRDVGTAFNVVRDGKALHVAVAEGAVMFRPDRERLMLGAGDALTIDQAGSRPRLSRVTAADIGGWRRGRLSFSAAPLANVTTALSRNLGAAVAIAPDLSDQTFTGSISLDGGAARVVPRVAGLLDVTWRRDGDRWILSSRGHALR